MRPLTNKTLYSFAMGLIFALAIPTLAAADDKEEKYQAFAINRGNVANAASSVIDFAITRWTTEAERKELIEILATKSHKEFIKALRNQKETGWIRGSGGIQASMAYPSTTLRYAFQFDMGDKREVMLVTDRPLSMGEVARQDRSVEYDISTIVLVLPKDTSKNGTGELFLAAEASYDKEHDKVKLEPLGTAPVQLNDVKKMK